MVNHLIFLGTISLFISTLPLLFPFAQNYEYEYSLILGVAALIIFPIAACFAPIKSFYHLEKKKLKINLWTAGILILVVINIVPTFQFLFNFCRCSKQGYIFWFLVNSSVSIILAYSAFWLVLKSRLTNTRVKTLFFLILTSALLSLHLMGTLWLYPQKRITHLLFGFIHGPIYDQWIPVDEGILWARFGHLMAALLLLFIVHQKKIGIYITSTLFLFSSGKASLHPSTQHGKRALREALPMTYQEPHFTLFYLTPKKPEDIKALEYLKDEIKFHVEELSEILGIENSKTIEIYLYPDKDTKKLLFGGYKTAVTDVQTPSIHLTLGSFPNSIIRHELVHAMASNIPQGLLKFHPNMAITEGLAVALAPEENYLSLDERAASILKSSRLESLREIMSPLFWLHSGSRSYTLAGSFIKYVNEIYGAKVTQKLYAGENYEEVFPKPIDHIISQWEDSIFSKYDEKKYSLYTEKLYRYPGVLKDECPHSKIDLSPSYSSKQFIELRRPRQWSAKRDYPQWLNKLEKKNKKDLINQLTENITSYVKTEPHSLERSYSFITQIKSLTSQGELYYEDILLEILKSDFYRFMDQKKQSRESLKDLQSLSKKIFFGPSLIRHIDMRINLEKLPEDKAKPWRLYLAGWIPIPKTNANELDWSLKYLTMKNMALKDKLPGKYMDWLRAAIPDHYSQEVKAEWYRSIALQLMKQGSFEEASLAWKKLRPVAPQGNSAHIVLLERLSNFMANSNHGSL